MKRVRNEKGVALLLVLILTLVASFACAGMLYLVARGGFLSGQQKRYKSAVEAAKGGIELGFQVVGDRAAIATPFPGSWIGPDLPVKLVNATENWPSTYDNSVTINPAVPASYDMSFTLGDYSVYAKVVDTVIGNSSASTGLLSTGVVTTGSGEVIVVSQPYLYTIEEVAQSTANPTERVKFSVLYQY